MLELISRGGIFSYLVLVWGAILYAVIFRQLVARDARHLPALRGALAAMMFLGLAGSCIGLVEAGAVAGKLTVPQWRAVLTIAPIPLAVASCVAVPASLLIGLADVWQHDGTDGIT